MRLSLCTSAASLVGPEVVMGASRSFLVSLTALLMVAPSLALATGQISGSVIDDATGAPLLCEVEVLEIGGGWITKSVLSDEN